MPAAKSLDAHVRDGTFRSRRHRHLLEGPVVPWPELAVLQARYAATRHELERRAIGVEFERAIRVLSQDETEAKRRAAERAELESIVFAEPAEIDFDEMARVL